MLEKTIRVNALYDFYHPLLTPKQQSYMSLYYINDFSLREIADECNVSRQAVYDTIKRTEIMLEDYEEKLHLYEKFKKRGDVIRQLYDVLDNKKNTEVMLNLIKQLEKLD
ncbi:putative DNA-binding protein [Pueribacillus theae]|uniref:UPF0122 protein DCC39_00885 n=1 Tax=Pueribacillus theae TaxID=2171751 RepID=A0A2U1K8I8_9BACI|nr:putative DNA-binding protein [Pueribacillus theae]PWA13478.1 putative DNA-binding protein [Pueribacillus theae]